MADVTVVILTYNRAAMLPRAIESVLAQTQRNIDILVVDDASTDDTPQVMAGYSGNVRYVRRAVNGGEAAARNTGWRNTTSEFITYLDDDDCYEPEKIRKELTLLRRRPEAGLAYCRYYYMTADGRRLDSSVSLPEGDVLDELLMGCFVLSHAPLIRREWLERIDGFDEALALTTDWDAWLRLSLAGCQFVCVQEPLVGYRMHGGNVTKSVEKWLRDGETTLERAFGNPRLQSKPQTFKGRAIGMHYFRGAMAYYHSGDWEMAQRAAQQMLRHDPALLQDERALVTRMCDAAFDPRCTAPLKFIAGVFDHLPADLRGLDRYRADALARVHIEVGLRAIAQEDAGLAGEHFAAARTLASPEMLEMVFLDRVHHVANVANLGDPRHFVDCAIQLADGMIDASGLRRQARANLNIAKAFEDFVTGRRDRVPTGVVTAIVNKPSLAFNRGVIKILVKSVMSPNE